MRIKLIMLTLLLTSSVLSAANPLKLSVYPKVGMIPHTVRVKVTVEKNPDNRSLCLVWGKSEEGFGSSSCMDIDGSSPKTIFFKDKVLRESGQWFFVVKLLLVTGKTYAVTDYVEVVGGF